MSDLTDAQKARIPEFQAKWTENAKKRFGMQDKPTAERGIEGYYGLEGINLPYPGHVIWATSPFTGALISSILDAVLNMPVGKLPAKVKATRDKEGKVTKGNLWVAYPDFAENVWGGVMQIFKYDFSRFIVEPSKAETQLPPKDEKELRDRVERIDAKGVLSSGWSRFVGGNLWAGWAAYVDFEQNVLNVTRPSTDCARWVAENTSWWWPHEAYVVASEFPIQIHFDEQRRLHNPDGPAFEWGDGFKGYYWQDVKVPEKVIMDPDSITVQEVLEEKNAEVRRCMLAKVGWEKLVTSEVAEIIDADTVQTTKLKFGPGEAHLLREWIETNGFDKFLVEPPVEEMQQDRTLYRLKAAIGEPIVLLSVTCPSSGKRYLNRVNPVVKTCQEAVARRFGESAATYKPVFEA